MTSENRKTFWRGFALGLIVGICITCEAAFYIYNGRWLW